MPISNRDEPNLKNPRVDTKSKARKYTNWLKETGEGEEGWKQEHLGNVDDKLTELRVIASLLLEPIGYGFTDGSQSERS